MVGSAGAPFDGELERESDSIGAVVVVGAGPAGLTAAYQLAKRGATCTVFEMDAVVGGLSRTVEREGWRFDIGGHRFFTKVPEVDELWQEILGPEDFLLRPRLSRIYYNGTYFDYPIQIGNALRGLGPMESMRCGMSFLWVRLHPPKNLDSFEGWTARAFGWRLYRKFFKTYTEKVWGIPASEIKADWAAQRIKSLTLGNAVRERPHVETQAHPYHLAHRGVPLPAPRPGDDVGAGPRARGGAGLQGALRHPARGASGGPAVEP